MGDRKPKTGQSISTPNVNTSERKRLAHQEDNVGVLVESPGHTDPLPLTPTQVDALNHHNAE